MSNTQEERAAKRRDDRRAQIIRAAKQVFAEQGYNNASISQIIAQAKIARGTFYLYFDGKRKVFDSILSEALAGLTERIVVIDLGDREATPRQQVAHNLQRVLTFLLDDRPLSQLLLTPGLTPDLESAQRLGAFYERLTQMIAASLDHGIRMGLVRSCDTEIVAAALLGAIRGVTRRLLHHDGDPDVERVIDEILTFGWRGVIVETAWE
ncbi:MAG: TetR/AcrR family transcriptional regulator [Deltaproteobacteria bacterium]|nr:TetR/AcrR family transcriptional regulator [Deltaproteobacteria bacterium]